MKHLILSKLFAVRNHTQYHNKAAACTYDMLGCISLSEVRMLGEKMSWLNCFCSMCWQCFIMLFLEEKIYFKKGHFM